MAGRPKRRARLAQRALHPIAEDSAIPDALPSPARARTGAHNARAQQPPQHSSSRPPPAPRPLRSPLIGGATRTVADDAQAETLLKIAGLIKPGVEIRIERTRPGWAAGWIEDYPIDAGGDALRSLYERLRDEHGGQLYRLTVLAPGDTPVYVGAVPIAGPVRHDGRIITRDSWDPPGRDREPRAQPAAAPAQAFPMAEMLGAFGQFMQLFTTQSEKSSQLQLEAVRDMVRSSQQQTSDLTAAVLELRSSEHQQRGLSGQIAELMEGMSAVDQLRKRFGAAASKNGAESEEGMLNGALKDAMGHFIGAVAGSMAQRAQPRAPRRVPRPPVNAVSAIPPKQVVGAEPQGIPDAIPGHAASQN
jgi:hypothetical protein